MIFRRLLFIVLCLVAWAVGLCEHQKLSFKSEPTLFYTLMYPQKYAQSPVI